MAKPAIILCDEPQSGLRVAGLTVLDRLVVALHRGGCSPILIVAGAPLPELKRAGALEIPWERCATADTAGLAALVMRGNLLIEAADVQEVLRAGQDLVSADGAELLLHHVAAGAPAVMPNRGSGIRARGVARHVSSTLEARAGARALWASLKSASDGTVDKYFNRPCGRPLSRLLIHTAVTPNQISVASIVIGLAGAWLLGRGDFASAIEGALLFQLSAIVDCVDGDVARMMFKESWLGKWLDIMGDQVVHAAVFIGIGTGLARAGSTAPVGWLAGSAVAGALVAFAVVLRGMNSGVLKGNNRLQALLDRATNRDFSVVVLGLAVLHGLDWFLWMAAVGSHVFWVMALFLQWQALNVTPTSVESRR